MTCMSLPAPTLLTARLRLRSFDAADANDLFALHSNAYVLRYWDAPPWSERKAGSRRRTECWGSSAFRNSMQMSFRPFATASRATL